VITQPRKVLYFDFEMSTAQFAARYSEAGRAFSFSPNLIRVVMVPARAEPDDYGFASFGLISQRR
jgi:hypothetical protein